MGKVLHDLRLAKVNGYEHRVPLGVVLIGIILEIEHALKVFQNMLSPFRIGRELARSNVFRKIFFLEGQV